MRRGDDVSKRDGKRRPRIDWDAAFAYFCSDSTVTFTKVAKRFGVSVTAVCKHAKPDNWNDRRAAMHAKAAANLDNKVLGTLEERNRETLLLIRKGVSQIDNSPDAPKWSDLPALVKLEQLLEGEATDRVSLAEVSQLALALSRGHDQLVMRIFEELLPSGKRRQAVELWRTGSSDVLEQASQGLLELGPGEQDA